MPIKMFRREHKRKKCPNCLIPAKVLIFHNKNLGYMCLNCSNFLNQCVENLTTIRDVLNGKPRRMKRQATYYTLLEIKDERCQLTISGLNNLSKLDEPIKPKLGEVIVQAIQGGEKYGIICGTDITNGVVEVIPVSDTVVISSIGEVATP